MNLFRLLIVILFFFSTKTTAQNNTKNKCFQIISGIVRDKVSNEIIHDATVMLYKENTLIRIIKTNNKGVFTFNVACRSSYSLVAGKSQYTETKKEFTSSNVSNIRVLFTMYIAPEEVCTQIISGKILENLSNNPIEDVKIQIKDKNGAILSTHKTDTNGAYRLNLTCYQEFKILFFKEGYISTAKTETTENVENVRKKNITLHLTPCKQVVKSIVLNAKTNKPIKNAIATLSKNNIEIRKKRSDAEGKFSFNVDCLSSYKIKTTAPNFNFILKSFSTSKINNETLAIVFKLDAIDNQRTAIIKNPLKIKEPISPLNQIKFKVNTSKITPKTTIELDKIVMLLKSKPTAKIEINSHTDSRGPDQYNLNLTQARAQTLISYIISKGIDATRVSGKGYGETKLLNDCTNDKRCSEKEHQKNKRIEIIILKNETN